MSNNKKQTSIRDVAAHAKVSIGTVSRVINNHENVQASTIYAVRQSMKKLGYKLNKNPNTKTMPGTKTTKKSICFCIGGKSPEWRNHPHINHLIAGAEAACRKSSLNLQVEFNKEQGPRPRCLNDANVKGIIFRGNIQNHKWIKSNTRPFIGIDLREGADFTSVGPDDRIAGIQMAELVWNMGHKKIAFVSTTNQKHFQFLQRQQGIEEFLRLRDAYNPNLISWGTTEGIGAAPETSYPETGPQINGLLQCTRANRPTAIIAANDWIAAGIYLALRKRGVEPGRDISVVGFDNNPHCEILFPKLTSYQFQNLESAELATNILINLINGRRNPHIPGRILLPGVIKDRDSALPYS